jgi:hypothetical protein
MNVLSYEISRIQKHLPVNAKILTMKKKLSVKPWKIRKKSYDLHATYEYNNQVFSTIIATKSLECPKK